MSSSKLLSWLALAATVIFVAIVTLQALEFFRYRADPSLWPLS